MQFVFVRFNEKILPLNNKKGQRVKNDEVLFSPKWFVSLIPISDKCQLEKNSNL